MWALFLFVALIVGIFALALCRAAAKGDIPMMREGDDGDGLQGA